MQTSDDTPFRLGGMLPLGGFPWFACLVERGVERALKLDALDGMYRDLPPARGPDDFLDAVLRAFTIRVDIVRLLHPAPNPVSPRGGRAIIAATPTSPIPVKFASLVNPIAPFHSLWRQRELLRQMTERDTRSRYRGSAVGLFWSRSIRC